MAIDPAKIAEARRRLYGDPNAITRTPLGTFEEIKPFIGQSRNIITQANPPSPLGGPSLLAPRNEQTLQGVAHIAENQENKTNENKLGPTQQPPLTAGKSSTIEISAPQGAPIQAAAGSQISLVPSSTSPQPPPSMFRSAADDKPIDLAPAVQEPVPQAAPAPTQPEPQPELQTSITVVDILPPPNIPKLSETHHQDIDARLMDAIDKRKRQKAIYFEEELAQGAKSTLMIVESELEKEHKRIVNALRLAYRSEAFKNFKQGKATHEDFELELIKCLHEEKETYFRKLEREITEKLGR